MSHDGKRVKRTAKRRNGRALRLVVAQPGEIVIREGVERGRKVDYIEAPEGTKVEPVQKTA